jgi:hypothetical protein
MLITGSMNSEVKVRLGSPVFGLCLVCVSLLCLCLLGHNILVYTFIGTLPLRAFLSLFLPCTFIDVYLNVIISPSKNKPYRGMHRITCYHCFGRDGTSKTSSANGQKNWTHSPHNDKAKTMTKTKTKTKTRLD